MSYYLAPSLVRLREEINTRWPNRSKVSDGWIGDTSHSARASDHNPDWSSNGVVRALDVTVAGIDREACLKAIIGDPRVWYVISNGIIYSRTYGWAARRYTGPNPHVAHFHVSILHSKQAEESTLSWLAPAMQNIRTTGLPRVNLRNLRVQARKPSRRLPGVRRVQRALNARYKARLKVDGWYGPATRRAFSRHERHIGTPRPNGIPKRQALTDLGRGRFKVVPKKKVST